MRTVLSTLFAFLFTAIFATTTPSLAQDATASDSFLTAPQLEKLLNGNSFDARTNDGRWMQLKYRRDGNLDIDMGHRRHYGSWSVEGKDKYCFKIRERACRRIKPGKDGGYDIFDHEDGAFKGNIVSR